MTNENKSLYDSLREKFGDCDSDEKLIILRQEMISPITTIQSFSFMLHHLLLEKKYEELPENTERLISRIVESGNNLREVLDALTMSSDNSTADDMN